MAVVFRIADQPAEYLAWAVFAALLISGITTIIQAARVWRIGAGHILVMGASGAFFAVCVAALVEGGPAVMASLVVISALFQFALAARLSVLRRIFTPVVSGTVIMLIAATVMPIVFDMLAEVPDGHSFRGFAVGRLGNHRHRGGPRPAGISVVAALVARRRHRRGLCGRGIVVGCAVAAPFGLYDVQYVKDAPWIGIPFGAWPGLDFTPGVEFWALLPAFIVVTLVGAIETIGDGVAIQRVSRRRPQATDYCVVQGALNADGLGNFLSGIAGTLPNTTYSTSISLAEVTGIAARRVGIVVGVIFIVLAFFPKATALLIAIPSPVAATYVGVLIALLFVQGMRIIIQDGLDHRKATVAGVSFWIGVGFQNGVIFPELLGDGFLAILLGNDMTSGAIVAVLIDGASWSSAKPLRRRLRVPNSMPTHPRRWTNSCVHSPPASGGTPRPPTAWPPPAKKRWQSSRRRTTQKRRQRPRAGSPWTLSREGSTVELEFVSALAGDNVEDHLSYLSALPPVPDGRRGLLPPAPPLRLRSPPPEVPRPRCGDGQRIRRRLRPGRGRFPSVSGLLLLTEQAVSDQAGHPERVVGVGPGRERQGTCSEIGEPVAKELVRTGQKLLVNPESAIWHRINRAGKMGCRRSTPQVCRRPGLKSCEHNHG